MYLCRQLIFREHFTIKNSSHRSDNDWCTSFYVVKGLPKLVVNVPVVSLTSQSNTECSSFVLNKTLLS